jgi:hypothetical protein
VGVLIEVSAGQLLALSMCVDGSQCWSASSLVYVCVLIEVSAGHLLALSMCVLMEVSAGQPLDLSMCVC